MLTRSNIFSLMPVLPMLLLLFFPAVSYASEQLRKTPGDHEGPFYPVERQQDEDNDLIHVSGHAAAATGDILYLSGKAVDTAGNPIANAVVEIWQTDRKGLYKDRRDRSPGARDPDFQYWGKTETGDDGTFSFTTLVPGKYEPRPAHIHFKVWLAGQAALTSQMYFSNHPDENISGGPVITDPLQTIELHQKTPGTFEAFFRIVL